MHDVMMPWRYAATLLIALAATACQEPASTTTSTGSAPETRTQALEERDIAARSILLDARAEGVHGERAMLRATPEPVREGTDAYRTMVLGEAPSKLGIKSGTRVLDAQFVEDGVVILGADHVLRHHTERGIKEIATNALGPLSVAGDRVAYVHGEAPDLLLAVADLESGESTQIAPTLAPVWSPALSQDGEQVIFVASFEGRPHFFRADMKGNLESIPTGLRTPSAPVAPIWMGDELLFQDERGVVRFALETASIEEDLIGAKLLPEDGSGKVRVEINGEVRELGLEGGAR
jgi:hypothetical protein